MDEAWRYEQGPIRPPNEAWSLLLRVTRNCPWNRCAFCPVYKGHRFSVRRVEDVVRDIDAIHACVELLRRHAPRPEDLGSAAIQRARAEAGAEPVASGALDAAVRWYAGGLKTVFLQDANSLAAKTGDLAAILIHLRQRFPQVERVTSYARSQTLAGKAPEELRVLAEAGLNRVHIGMESGSDAVLALVRKGATKALHIAGALQAKGAGLEVSEYVMPGLGGRALSEEHAAETADALNRINPHFIRLRTLAIPKHVPLREALVAGRFVKCTEREVVGEIIALIEKLEGIGSVVKSDHILNLFEDLEGRLPEDKPAMLGMLRRFLRLGPETRLLYQVGRRLGVYRSLSEIDDEARRDAVRASCDRYGITPENVDAVVDEIMMRFI